MTENDEILEYLMTSDFNEELNKSELKALLIKFREFYRYMYSVKDNKVIDRDFKIKNFEQEITFMKEEVVRLKSIKSELENEKNLLKRRKLSFMERIRGKLDI
jgi:hypothetical protein